MAESVGMAAEIRAVGARRSGKVMKKSVLPAGGGFGAGSCPGISTMATYIFCKAGAVAPRGGNARTEARLQVGAVLRRGHPGMDISG